MRKPAKRPSFGRRLLRFFFSSASVIAISVGNFIVRNPVMTGGATAFAVVMGFVSANALWYQPQAHDTVFIQTRSDFTFKAVPRAVLSRTIASGANIPTQMSVENEAEGAVPPDEIIDQQSVSAETFSPNRLQLNGSIDEMLPALAPNADLDVARLQQSLLALGIYKGEVDGFTGPQTREAVEQWQKLQAKLGAPQKVEVSTPRTDDVKRLIDREVPVPQPHPKPTVAKAPDRAQAGSDVASLQSEKPRQAVPPADVVPLSGQKKITSQDIVRVQAGLKAFGNGQVSVDGVPGKSTRDAVKEFQKLFNLPTTGEIDAALIGKMREIGLIS